MGKLKKTLIVKNIITWSIIAFCCSIALITFVGQFSADMKAGTDIFLPGVSVLALSVAGLLVLSVWRCIKNMKLLKSIGKGDAYL